MSITHGPDGSPDISTVKRAVNQNKIPNASYREGLLGLGLILSVDYEQHRAVVHTLKGGPGHTNKTIPLTFPGAGHRGFLGRMPETGDLCVLGYTPGTTNSRTSQQPVILTWLSPAPWMGQDWLSHFEISPTDPHDVNLKILKDLHQNGRGYIRAKLRHMLPGSILASSSQGSDLILDDDVLLSNRRANEIRLRDADQALVVRTLQQFHVMGGARIYGGLVQRDYGLIPEDMYVTPDKVIWDAPMSLSKNETSPKDTISENLDNFSIYTPDKFPKTKDFSYTLTPHSVFLHENGDFALKPYLSGLDIPYRLDPYSIYSRAGLLYNYSVETDFLFTLSRDTYGGINFHRITKAAATGSLEDTNGKISPLNPGLTEYRIELAHTHDGTLPVTEQTERFDVDRMSDSNPELLNPNVPYVEVVYGSVVGNDITTKEGLRQYAKPLTTIPYDSWGTSDDIPSRPVVKSIRPGDSIKSKESPKVSDIGAQAATLLRVRPTQVPELADNVSQDSYFSMSKDGRAAFNIGGPSGKPSVEGFLSNGLKLYSRGKVQLDSDQGIHLIGRGFSDITGRGIGLTTVNSGILIDATGFLATNITKTSKDSTYPRTSVHVRGSGAIHLQTPSSLILDADKIEFLNGKKFEINAISGISLNTGDLLQFGAKAIEKTVMGSETNTYVGPKNNIPTNGPTRNTNFYSSPATGHVSGAVDKTYILYGDQETYIDVGSKLVDILTGSIKSSVEAGAINMRAGLNKIDLSTTSGLDVKIGVGDTNITNLAGSINFQALQTISIMSADGVVISGSSRGVYLGGPVGPKNLPFIGVGSVLSSLDVDPITGATYSTYFMGASSIQIGSPI